MIARRPYTRFYPGRRRRTDRGELLIEVELEEKPADIKSLWHEQSTVLEFKQGR